MIGNEIQKNENTLSEQEQIDRDLDMWEMERNWQESLPKYEEAQWLNIFPEAKKRFGRYIKGRLKIEKKYLLISRDNLVKETNQKLADNIYGSWRDDLIKDYHERETHRINKRLRTIEALIELIERIGNKKPEKINKVLITEMMVQRAREYPIENLVEINRAGFTKCFAHNDKHPSAYCKKNFIHCFVCQKSWDTIQILIERDGMQFKEAVLKLQ